MLNIDDLINKCFVLAICGFNVFFLLGRKIGVGFLGISYKLEAIIF